MRAQEQRLLEESASRIDEYIRTRRKFRSDNPSAYVCQVSATGFAQFVDAWLKSAMPLRDNPEPYTPLDVLRYFGSSRFLLDETAAPAPTVQVQWLTPYQGDDRMYGCFKCSECHRAQPHGRTSGRHAEAAIQKSTLTNRLHSNAIAIETSTLRSDRTTCGAVKSANSWGGFVCRNAST